MALPGHLPEAMETPMPLDTVGNPSPGNAGQVMIHKMGKAKRGLLTAYGTGNF